VTKDGRLTKFRLEI